MTPPTPPPLPTAFALLLCLQNSYLSFKIRSNVTSSMMPDSLRPVSHIHWTLRLFCLKTYHIALWLPVNISVSLLDSELLSGKNHMLIIVGLTYNTHSINIFWLTLDLQCRFFKCRDFLQLRKGMIEASAKQKFLLSKSRSYIVWQSGSYKIWLISDRTGFLSPSPNQCSYKPHIMGKKNQRIKRILWFLSPLLHYDMYISKCFSRVSKMLGLGTKQIIV